jgi:hypothetical protein
MPVEIDPLWHEAQGVAATAVWVIIAGFHAVVRWQLSQAAVALVPPLWFVGMPVEVLP